MLALQLACGGWIAAATAAIARVGVADLLAGGPRTVASLAAASQTHAPTLERVLDLLAGIGLFERRADGSFANNAESELLRADHARSIRQFVMLAAGPYQAAFAGILTTLRSGDSAAPAAFGGSLYRFLESDPDAADVYDRAMEDLARPVAALLARDLDLAGARHVVDVGGGRGTIVKALLAAHAGLRGTCIDRPDVCARAAAQLAADAPALVGRLDFVAADFFAGVPAGADLYLLKNVLHNWNDRSAAAILSRVATAMGDRPGARLAVIEPLPQTGTMTTYEQMDDLLQRVVCEGGSRARSPDELTALLASAGLRVIHSQTLDSGHSVVQATCAV